MSFVFNNRAHLETLCNAVFPAADAPTEFGNLDDWFAPIPDGEISGKDIHFDALGELALRQDWQPDQKVAVPAFRMAKTAVPNFLMNQFSREAKEEVFGRVTYHRGNYTVTERFDREAYDRSKTDDFAEDTIRDRGSDTYEFLTRVVPDPLRYFDVPGLLRDGPLHLVALEVLDRYKHPTQPATQLLPWQAQAFCDWFSAKTGIKVALPTLAEWRRAAGGISGQDAYATSDGMLSEANARYAPELHSNKNNSNPLFQGASLFTAPSTTDSPEQITRLQLEREILHHFVQGYDSFVSHDGKLSELHPHTILEMRAFTQMIGKESRTLPADPYFRKRLRDVIRRWGYYAAQDPNGHFYRNIIGENHTGYPHQGDLYGSRDFATAVVWYGLNAEKELVRKFAKSKPSEAYDEDFALRRFLEGDPYHLDDYYLTTLSPDLIPLFERFRSRGVGAGKPNSYGLFNLCGNVEEMISGVDVQRIGKAGILVAGGCYLNPASAPELRADTLRSEFLKSTDRYSIGFRVVA